MNHKRTTISIVLATVMFVSLFAVVSTATGVSGTVMTGTGPAASVVWSNPQQTHIFAVDTSGALWHTTGNGNWNSLGGSATSSPAATSRNANGLTVFVRGMNGSIYYRDYVGSSWGPWTCIGGQVPVNVGPAVSSWGGGRLDVFVQGMNGGMYHRSYTPTSGWAKNWDYLGGRLTSAPAATALGTSRIDVFVRGTNGSVYQKTWNNGWSGWTSLGGQLAPNTGPAVLGGIGVFVQGTDHQLWWQQFGEAGSVWSRLPACPEVLSASSPAVIFNPHGHTVVFVSTTSGNLMSCSAWATGWEWYSVPGSP